MLPWTPGGRLGSHSPPVLFATGLKVSEVACGPGTKGALAKAFGRKPRVRQAGEGQDVPGPSEATGDTYMMARLLQDSWFCR